MTEREFVTRWAPEFAVAAIRGGHQGLEQLDYWTVQLARQIYDRIEAMGTPRDGTKPE